MWWVRCLSREFGKIASALGGWWRYLRGGSNRDRMMYTQTHTRLSYTCVRKCTCMNIHTCRRPLGRAQQLDLPVRPHLVHVKLRVQDVPHLVLGDGAVLREALLGARPGAVVEVVKGWVAFFFKIYYNMCAEMGAGGKNDTGCAVCSEARDRHHLISCI